MLENQEKMKPTLRGDLYFPLFYSSLRQVHLTSLIQIISKAHSYALSPQVSRPSYAVTSARQNAHFSLPCRVSS